jgi:hypothetical protein
MKYTNKIEGFISDKELQWLFDTASKSMNIVEIGSLNGKSTHALCSGTKGNVTTIDYIKTDDLENNLKEFNNLKIITARQLEVINEFEEESIDMLFLDFTTDLGTYEESIKMWLPKVKGIICGHEYIDKWPMVKLAVERALNKPDGIVESIWYKKII